MIFDTISVKARWERWCRWNCDLRVINTWKKAFSDIPKALPWHQNRVHICTLRHYGELLQNGQLKLWRWSWYLAWETHKDTAISVWAHQAGFWKSARTSCQQQNCQYGLVSKPFSSPQMIIYQSAFCIAMSQLKCLVWSMFLLLLFFTLPLDQTWLIHDGTLVKLNFTFFSVPQWKLLYITSKVVSNVTKSSASDDLLYVNCNVTNQTQTCFQSMQVVDCLPGLWVYCYIEGPFISLL